MPSRLTATLSSGPSLVAASALLAAAMSLVTAWLAEETVLTETVTFASGLLTTVVCGCVYLTGRTAQAHEPYATAAPVKEVIVTLQQVQCLTGGAPAPLGLHLSDHDEVIDLTEGGLAEREGGLRVGDRIVRVGSTAVSADQPLDDLIRCAATAHGRVALAVLRSDAPAEAGGACGPGVGRLSQTTWPTLWPHLAQSALGGSMPHLIFYSISLTGLAVSNCLVFMMPLWTGIFVALLGPRGEGGWGLEDVVLALVSLAGVVFVSQPWAGAFSAAGVGAGVAAGAVGGLLNFLFASNPLIRATDSWFLVACQGIGTMVFALPSLVLHAGDDLGELAPRKRPSAQAFACASMLLGLVGILFVLSQQLRFSGLQVATSSTVVTLLYTEVVWAFLFEQLFTDMPKAGLPKYLGVLLIVGGAIVNKLGWDKRLFDLCRPARRTREDLPAPIRLSDASSKEMEAGLEAGHEKSGAPSPPPVQLHTYGYLLGFAALLYVGEAHLQLSPTEEVATFRVQLWSIIMGLCIGAYAAYVASKTICCC